MAEFSVAWALAAREDFFDIVDYIADERPLVAQRVAARIDRAAQALRQMPHRGRRVPELASVPELAAACAGFELREVVVRPWRMVYSIEGQQVTIVAVVDSRMDMLAWLDRHLSRLMHRGAR